MSEPETIGGVLSRKQDGMDGLLEAYRANGRACGSYITPEEYAAMSGREAPETRCELRASGGGVDVTVACPRAATSQWAAWLRQLAQSCGWEGGVRSL